MKGRALAMDLMTQLDQGAEASMVRERGWFVKSPERTKSINLVGPFASEPYVVDMGGMTHSFGYALYSPKSRNILSRSLLEMAGCDCVELRTSKKYPKLVTQVVVSNVHGTMMFKIKCPEVGQGLALMAPTSELYKLIPAPLKIAALNYKFLHRMSL